MIPKSNHISLPSQANCLEGRRNSEPIHIECSGMPITVHSGVYQTSGDSELMAECVEITETQNFLEIGCGSGVVSIAIAKRAASGIGVDINERAVENSRLNALSLGISNLEFFRSDVFESVTGKFDVIICNPPYTNHEAKDTIERMFWDPEDEMKRKFFKQAQSYLKPDWKVYFGWADFADIDIELPFRLAKENGYSLENTFSKPHSGAFIFYVFEFCRLD